MLIVRYAEVALKGKNRQDFEKRLVHNIRACLQNHEVPFTRIQRLHGRIVVHTETRTDCLKEVFGIASFSNTINTGTSLDDFKKILPPHIKDIKKEDSFRITCQRIDKTYPLNRRQVEEDIGAFVQEATKATVNLTRPKHNIQIEIIQGHLYLCTDRIQCFGGLPVGVEGRVLALIENKADVLATLLILKRGAAIMPIAFKQTSIDILKKFSHGFSPVLHIIHNLKEIDDFATLKRAKAVVIGQTLKTYKDLGIQTPILRPLVAYSEKQIEEELNDFDGV